MWPGNKAKDKVNEKRLNTREAYAGGGQRGYYTREVEVEHIENKIIVYAA